MAVIRQEELVLDIFKAQVAANKNFTTTIKKPRAIQISLGPGIHTTTCLTCHKHCGIPDDAQKNWCWAMRNNYCRICPSKCIWSVHKNLPYRFEYTLVQETVTLEDIKTKYKEAEEEAGKKISLIDKIEKSLQ